MAKVRAKKITATEILADGGKHLLSEHRRGGLKVPDSIRKVVLRSDTYYLYFFDSPPMMLTANLVRTLAKTFGDDCDEWKGAPVMLIHLPIKLLIRKNKDGLPVMTVQ
jgi:hypothetical protein